MMRAFRFGPGGGVLAALLVVLGGCRAEGGGEAPLFERLDPEATGVTFENTLAEGEDFNIFNYLYYYNGGGVATGDVNGDGLLDLYFTANELPNRLYLNRTEPGGPLRFEDVTEATGVAGSGNWTTGVVMADVNGDGLLDLYVMNVGGYLDRVGHNELFVNEGPGPDGVPRFAERAAEFGLDFEGYATHAAFFDYDRDGDLDVYLLNHSTHTERTYRPAEAVRDPHERAGDRLLRNEGGRFVDVSEEAGILSGAAGYGLSTAVADFNDDGWPDLFVGNDFHETDLLYLNNRDGTFREVVERAMPHVSTFSMGADAADLDGDGRVDLAVLDMLPVRESIRKTSAEGDSYSLYNLKRRLGYHHQLARNVLHLNRGSAPGEEHPRFSDIAPLAGVEATDWSWAALFADLDLDGHRDLFVTNGIYRRPNDLDYVNYISSEVVQASLRQGIPETDLPLLEKMPQVPIPNAAFRNRGDLTFEDAAASWGLGEPGFSNGAAYADLDNDGDLDLVVNNVNAPASLYENHADRLLGRHYLTIALDGEGANTGGIGARVTVQAGGRRQVVEQVPTRGFQSSVDPRLHVGLGAATVVDTLTVHWPDGRVQTLAGVAADRILTLRQEEATAQEPPTRPRPEPLFRDATAETVLPYRHEENEFVDFNREKLMPHKRSTEGPALAVGDVDGDGLDDVFLGGAKHQPASLLLQRASGGFAPADVPAFRADSLAEDVDAAFFDADGDGDLDLYVVSGGNEFWGEAEPLRDRLYRNDGDGGFARDTTALPRLFENGGTVAPGDFDGDGDLDLFVGNRTVARAYGRTPPSSLLENDGAGRFRDVTAERAPELADAGMVSDATWADLDGDGDLDLVVVGEWMRLSVFENGPGSEAGAGNTLRLREGDGLGGTSGWWNTVTAADLDGDGDLDLVAGNLGLNSTVRARPEAPARLYLNDFDGNGSADAVLTTVRDGGEYPYASFDLLRGEFVALRKRYPSYASFGARRVDELFTRDQMEGAEVREATTFASVWAENDGGGRFTVHPLPTEAQFAPVYAILPGDFDGDGRADLLLAGNFSGVRPVRGREDASYGLVLRGTAAGFEPLSLAASGVALDGEVRAIAPVRRADGTPLLLVARNDDRPLVLHPQRLVSETGIASRERP